MASIVTIDEPEMAANTAHDSTQATAMPPGRGFVTEPRMRISRCAIEPRVITLPHRMNSGIDRITSLSRPTHMSSMMKSSLPCPHFR